MNIAKRIAEINARRAELRTQLERGENIDLDAITTELRNLNAELESLEKRQKTINDLNNGSALANVVTPFVTERSADDFDQEREYRSAWLNSIRGVELTEAEKRALTTASNSVGAVVPTVTRNKIIEKVNQYCPLLGKIELLNVPGNVTIPAEGTTVDAQIHVQGATITPDEDTLINVTLSAYEVTKLVTISKSVEKMSIDAFEAWLVRKIARKIAEKLGYLIIYGTGTNQAQGFNAIVWNDTNSITVGKDAALTAQDVEDVVALLNGGYDDEAEWYLSKRTFFNDFHKLMNKSKDNVVTEDNGVYRIMGYPVNFDDRVTVHEAFLGNLERGYAGNMPENVTITSQFVTRENAYDFLGCAMFDGKVQATEAFVKIVKATA